MLSKQATWKPVRHLSLSPEARINVNEQVCVADGMNYTPVERSAALHHLALTRLLVDLQADVARTCNNDDKYRDDGNLLQCSGALDWALLRCCQGEGISLELVNTVLQAGGSVSVKIMRKILRPELSTVVQAIVGARLSTAQQKWTRKKVLHEIIHRMDKDTVLATVRSMYAIGASLTYKLYENKETAEVFRIPRYPPRIIDIAAERGDLDVILLLKTFNVPWTDDTLTAAVRAGNIDLVSYVLEDNPVAQGYSPHYRSTPYAEAIRHRSPDIIHLLIERGCMDYLQDEFTFCSTLAAASEIGDFPLVKSLLELSHNAKSNILGYALTHAISANRTDIALLLLDAGASTARDRNVQVLGFTCIDISLQNEQDELTYLLGTACKNRNAILVQALLDHDASVFDCYGVSPLAEAVEWGDRSIIKSFITAGSSDRWTGGESVLAAMKKQDCEFMRLLLQSGIPYGERSLENAVRYGDEQMVRELLMYGACPADSYALVAAMETAPALFSLLVRETRRRYPQGTTECNKAILAAVDKGQPETVQTLLQCVGANQLGRVWSSRATPRNREMLSPLAAAIRKDGGTDISMVQTILQSGVDLDDIVVINPERTASGSILPQETSLLVAIGTKQLEMVRLLLAWGASVNLPAERGVKRTPMQKAAEMGSMPIVKLLLNHGADINAPPAARGGGTAVQLAAMRGYIGVVELLRGYGAEVTAPGSKVYGRSAIEAAAENGRFDMVKYLLDLGPQITSQLEGAIRLAKNQGHDAIVEVLEPALLKTNSLAQCQEHGFNPDSQQLSPALMPAAPGFIFEEPAVTAQISAAQVVQDASTSPPPCTSAKHQQPFCNRCSKPFSNTSALKRHRKTVHAARDRLKRVQCPICSQSFARQDIMIRHQAMHDQSGYEQCENCLNKFRKDYLRSKHSKVCK